MLDRREREVLLTRFDDRLSRLSMDGRALEAAMADVSPTFDLQRFVDSYVGFDERALNQARSVERNFEVLHNFYVEMVRFGEVLDGRLDRTASLNAPRDVDSAQRAGRLSKPIADMLLRWHQVRSTLQHDYPDIVAVRIHEAIVELDAQRGSLKRAFEDWRSTL